MDFEKRYSLLDVEGAGPAVSVRGYLSGRRVFFSCSRLMTGGGNGCRVHTDACLVLSESVQGCIDVECGGGVGVYMAGVETTRRMARARLRRLKHRL